MKSNFVLRAVLLHVCQRRARSVVIRLEVLQAALGMSGSSSYLISQQNVVVEGIDDFWIITELSNLLVRAGEQGLPEEAFVTPAGGHLKQLILRHSWLGRNWTWLCCCIRIRQGGRPATRSLRNC